MSGKHLQQPGRWELRLCVAAAGPASTDHSPALGRPSTGQGWASAGNLGNAGAVALRQVCAWCGRGEPRATAVGGHSPGAATVKGWGPAWL